MLHRNRFSTIYKWRNVSIQIVVLKNIYRLKNCVLYRKTLGFRKLQWTVTLTNRLRKLSGKEKFNSSPITVLKNW